MGQIVRATNETPIEQIASQRVAKEIESSSEPQQYVMVILVYESRFPTADHQCAVLLFISGTQPATNFEKEVAATLSVLSTILRRLKPRMFHLNSAKVITRLPHRWQGVVHNTGGYMKVSKTSKLVSVVNE
jgi:hypothetical protein